MSNEADKKAKELVNKMYGAYKNHNREYAKSCALICVDEILNLGFNKKWTAYWQSVRDAIKNLK